MVELVICSYLEPENVARLRDVSPRVRIHYHPELLPRPRYAADHVGEPPERTPEQEARWSELLALGEVLFDFDYHALDRFKERARAARWVQASSAGIGQLIRRYGFDEMDAVFTTAAGVHARPLAEFVLWGILAFAKNYPQARRQRRERVWRRFHNDDLEGATLGIVGLGSIGREVARLARPFGLRILGMKRSVDGVDASALGVDALYGPAELNALLAASDYVCVSTPHTPETEGWFDAAAFASMKPGSVLINIGRGAVVEEEALLTALKEGPLAGAVLDVAPQEPLPPEHPLWTLDNVILFPHSASTSRKENARLMDLTCDNLERYLDGRPLRNTFELARLY